MPMPGRQPAAAAQAEAGQQKEDYTSKQESEGENGAQTHVRESSGRNRQNKTRARRAARVGAGGNQGFVVELLAVGLTMGSSGLLPHSIHELS